MSPDWQAGIREEGCMYPHYGKAPHYSFVPVEIKGDKGFASILKDKKDWPDNFVEDPDCKGLGVYNCPYNKICEEK